MTYIKEITRITMMCCGTNELKRLKVQENLAYEAIQNPSISLSDRATLQKFIVAINKRQTELLTGEEKKVKKVVRVK